AFLQSRDSFSALTTLEKLASIISSHFFIIFSKAHNAQLRCEARNAEAAAYYLNHKNQRIVKMPRVPNHS
ncbi:hypothetical protein, partial [Vibrio cholerae]|uniref:hypothetical protein n=1 Tax=Vibrio cholerae TaxID=666 RepID=UPI002FC6B51F